MNLFRFFKNEFNFRMSDLLKTAYFYNQGLFNPVLEAINEKRVAAGADALELDRDLCKAADGYAGHLAKEPMRKYRKASPKELNGAGECLTFYRVSFPTASYYIIHI